MFRAIRAGEVLTLNRDYFRLGRPYERRVYEIARKHCGRKADWRIGLELLRKKMGARSPLKKFRFFTKQLAESNYLGRTTQFEFDEESDQVVFRNRGAWWESHRQVNPPPFRSLDTYERAKRYTMGEDVYTWEGDWKEFWRQSGGPTA